MEKFGGGRPQATAAAVGIETINGPTRDSAQTQGQVMISAARAVGMRSVYLVRVSSVR
jgi:hypothetical protein